MQIPTPTGQQAGSSPRRPYTAARRRRAAARRRKAVSTVQVHAVAAVAPREGVVVPERPAKFYARPDVLDPAEVQALLAACSSSRRGGVRDRALIAVGYWTCVRPVEAIALRVDDVDTDAGKLTIRSHNGERVVELAPEAAEALSTWVAKRRRLIKPLSGTGLFCTLTEDRADRVGGRPAPITRPVIERVLAHVARDAGVTKPVTLDALRAARAKELALAGAELADLSRLLDDWRQKTGERGLRLNYDKTRRLITELAPEAPCVGHFSRPPSPVTLPGVRTGKPPPNKGREFPAEVLTADELRKMLRCLSSRSLTGRRNKALFIVLWRGGLRIAEALDLEHRDLNLADGVVTVRHGKGNKRRLVGLDPEAAKALADWLKVRDVELGLPPEGKVFCTISLPTRGGPMGYTTAREALIALAKKAGINKRVHLHGLRHTHAFELSKEGVPLQVIQKQLGHNDLATTAHYIDHLHPREVVEAMQNRNDWSVARPRSQPAAAPPEPLVLVPPASASEPAVCVADWRAEARRRFGSDPLGWSFACPRCGHEASCGDFQTLGADPSRAAQECIGRARPAADGACTWAAEGLLGALGRGVVIEHEDGSTTEAFAFAGILPAGRPGG